MSTNITSDNGVEVEVCSLGIAVVNHEEETETWARLSDAQRVELAAALDPGRRGLHVRLDNQAKTLATFQRERDAAVARAEAAEARTAPAVLLHQPDGTRMDASHLPIGADDDPAVFVVRESDVAAVKVTESDQLRRAGETGIPLPWKADKVREKRDECAAEWVELEAIARAIDAEQATDPVEVKAEELMRVLAPETEDRTWGILTEPAREDFRRLARHVLGQESDL